MKFIYQPEGADPREYDLNVGKMPLAEVKAVQKASGLKFGAWGDALEEGDADLFHALLWVFLKRSNPTLAHHEVEFTMSEVGLDLTAEEIVQARDVLRAKKDRSPEENEALAELEDLAADDEAEQVDDPKASTD